MFSQACVILFTGGMSASVHAGIPLPPGADPPEQTPARADTPGADTLPGADPPLPGAEHAGRYGQRAGGSHPTGMQFCLMNKIHYTVSYNCKKNCISLLL